jgi:enterochelin esterase-like enzyme
MIFRIIPSISVILGVVSSQVAGRVIVSKTGQGPTGYEVTFTYKNASVDSAVLGNYLKPFTDQYHTTPQYSAAFDPHNWKPGDFVVSLDIFGDYGPGSSTKFPGFAMNASEDGVFTYTAPFPSGTYCYSIYPNCTYAPNCTLSIPDPENMPFETFPGGQSCSQFQVPYDAQFQSYQAVDLNYDFTLPVSDSNRGKLMVMNYSSSGSTNPAQDIHDVAVYLPADYGSSPNKKFPVLYLSHGGSDNGADWPNKMYAHHILDRLIMENHIEPTVVIFPTFTNISSNDETPSTSDQVFFSNIRENYHKYLFPWVEETFSVSTDPSHRAFGGLSLGGALTYEMYINATSYFGYFGIMSGALLPDADQSMRINKSMVQSNPDLATRGLLVGFGTYDAAFDDCRRLQVALDTLGIGYVSRMVPYGSHFYNTWEDILWTWGRVGLWKGKPVTDETGHGVP